FGHATTNDIAGGNGDRAEEERHAPSPRQERLAWHVTRQRQEDRGRENLPSLHTLKGETRIEAAMAERRVLENHRARAGDLAGDRESLNEAQQHQQDRSDHADVRVVWEEPAGDGGDAHQNHAGDQDVLSSMRVPPVTEHESADRPGDVADPYVASDATIATAGLSEGKKICGKTSDAAVA